MSGSRVPHLRVRTRHGAHFVRQPFSIGGIEIGPGERKLVDLPVSKLSNHTPVALPVHALHGVEQGPAMFVLAAIHGDELNGVEIIRRLLRTLEPGNIRGTLLCVPVVNAYGFIGRSRYLPDRRDLNRAFPGSTSGSLAARLAHIVMTEIVHRCEIGIDLHSAAIHRVNLPQIRCDFEKSARLRDLAGAFGADVVFESAERPGSLRKAARDAGIDVLVYEGGEGLRFDEFAIQVGVEGIARVMLKAGMLDASDHTSPDTLREAPRPPVHVNASTWVRAPEGGVLRTAKRIGGMVSEGEIIGHVANPYEDIEAEVRSPRRGIIIGRTTLPIVNMGDALFHIAWSDENAIPEVVPEPPRPVGEQMDEDEII